MWRWRFVECQRAALGAWAPRPDVSRTRDLRPVRPGLPQRTTTSTTDHEQLLEVPSHSTPVTTKVGMK